MATRDETRDWIKAVLAFRHMTPTDCARRAGIAPSTLNKFLNDPDYTSEPKAKTLAAIGRAVGFEPYEMPGPKRGAGFAEDEAVRYVHDRGTGDPLSDAAIRAMCQGNHAIDPWVLGSRALESAGYLPNDVVFVDLSERPTARDVVCAQIYDWSTGKTETVFRIFSPPFLVAATSDDRLMRPFLVDEDQVVIKGVVVSAVRPRRTLAA